MAVKIVETENERQLVFTIREKVFVEEQKVPIELEVDEYENEAIHFICQDGEIPVGASRLRLIDDYGKLERICILKPFRGKSFGKEIIAHMEAEIVNHGYMKAILHAQTHATMFYENLGYSVVSDEFMDAGIPHVTMEKSL